MSRSYEWRVDPSVPEVGDSIYVTITGEDRPFALELSTDRLRGGGMGIWIVPQDVDDLIAAMQEAKIVLTAAQDDAHREDPQS